MAMGDEHSQSLRRVEVQQSISNHAQMRQKPKESLFLSVLRDFFRCFWYLLIIVLRDRPARLHSLGLSLTSFFGLAFLL